MDYESVESAMGKPGGADLQLGLATGPALFAWEEHPELGPLIERKFKQPGDVELVRPDSCHVSIISTDTQTFQARDYVRRSSGLERTRELAQDHADKAKEVLSHLPDSDAKNALSALSDRVVKRTR